MVRCKAWKATSGPAWPLKLILCSTSPFRAALLTSIGFVFETIEPAFAETEIAGLGPRDTAIYFAQQKALSVATEKGALYLGCDQTLSLDQSMLRKPNGREAMHAQLTQLSGRVHQLHSAVCVTNGARTLWACETVALSMRSLTSQQIERYLTIDNPVGAVGAYYYEKRGRTLFETVTPADDSAIIGLPLLATLRLLRDFGVDPLDPVLLDGVLAKPS